MKQLGIIYIFFLVLLIGCDNRKDYFESIDTGATLTISKFNENNYATQIYDTLKVGIPYKLSYKISDNQRLHLSATQINGTDSVIINNNYVSIIAKNAGNDTVNLSVNDEYGKTSTVQFTYYSFINMPPICNYTVTAEPLLSPYQVQINASASYSPDSRWGGSIINYQYTVDGSYTVTLQQSSLMYIFETPGIKTISVCVEDNDNVWSAANVTYFTVQ